jgi:hypothetical protein
MFEGCEPCPKVQKVRNRRHHPVDGVGMTTPDFFDLDPANRDPMGSYFIYLSLVVAAGQLSVEQLDERIEELVRRWRPVASA